MGFKCYFCDTRDRVGYWSNWCEDCANLRRMLLLYDPKKCCDILKRTLTRDEKQIDFKVSQEIKKIVLNELPTIKEEKVEEDQKINENESDECYEKPTTRERKSKKFK